MLPLGGIWRHTKSCQFSNNRHSKITAEELSRKWNIGLKTAEATMNCTTQRGVRTATRPLSRRVRVDHLDLHRKRLPGVWYCDTLLAKVKSLLGNTVANVFTNDKFTKVVPLEARRFAGDSLVRFFDNVGVPEMMVMMVQRNSQVSRRSLVSMQGECG